MNTEDAQKLERLHDDGFLVIIDDSGYVDSPVNSIYVDDDGDLAYSSQVFSDRKLSTIPEHEVQVYAPAIKQWEHNEESIEFDNLEQYKYYLEGQDNET